jgi:hypothetical protein
MSYEMPIRKADLCSPLCCTSLRSAHAPPLSHFERHVAVAICPGTLRVLPQFPVASSLLHRMLTISSAAGFD